MTRMHGMACVAVAGLMVPSMAVAQEVAITKARVIVGSGQQYIINANWKLLAENSIDAFHGFPVHSTYFDYLKTLGALRMESAADFTASGMHDLGNGHSVIEYASPWGRTSAR